MNSEQHFNTIGTSRPLFRRCSPRSQPKTLSLKIPDCLRCRFDGLDKMNALKNAINLPCFLKDRTENPVTDIMCSLRQKIYDEIPYLSTGFEGSIMDDGWFSCKLRGTLSVMTATQCDGKNPTMKPRLPLHQTLSSGGGISITDIISPI